MVFVHLLLLLSSVYSSVCLGAEPDELVQNEDRLVGLCLEHRMHILLKKDYELFDVKGSEPECEIRHSEGIRWRRGESEALVPSPHGESPRALRSNLHSSMELPARDSLNHC
ncbi:hypothetical protein PMAYCL1PPCAC_28799, partial [Pristionchus mayeri]